MPDRIEILPDENATERWAARLADALGRQGLAEQAFVIHLSGDLGAGKTTLVRGILRGFGHRGPVKSPSFALLETYNFPSMPIYHFDLYRFSSPDQWFDAGFPDILAGPGLMLLEWPEQAAGALAPPDLHLRLQPVDATAAGLAVEAVDDPAAASIRTLAITAVTPAGRRCLSDPALTAADSTLGAAPTAGDGRC